MSCPPYNLLFEHRDNFVRNLVTVVRGGSGGDVLPSPPLSSSASNRTAVVSLDQIKMHLRIELSETTEDAYLAMLEMAARLHSENVLRRTIPDTGAGENIVLALLVLIAHWYRNREAVVAGDSASYSTVPLAYTALIGIERDYSGAY